MNRKLGEKKQNKEIDIDTANTLSKKHILKVKNVLVKMQFGWKWKRVKESS